MTDYLKELEVKTEEMLLHQVLDIHVEKDIRKFSPCTDCIREALNKGYEKGCKDTADKIINIVKEELSKFSQYILNLEENNHNFNRNSLSGMSYNKFLIIEKKIKELSENKK